MGAEGRVTIGHDGGGFHPQVLMDAYQRMMAGRMPIITPMPCGHGVHMMSFYSARVTAADPVVRVTEVVSSAIAASEYVTSRYGDS